MVFKYFSKKFKSNILKILKITKKQEFAYTPFYQFSSMTILSSVDIVSYQNYLCLWMDKICNSSLFLRKEKGKEKKRKERENSPGLARSFTTSFSLGITVLLCQLSPNVLTCLRDSDSETTCKCCKMMKKTLSIAATLQI